MFKNLIAKIWRDASRVDRHVARLQRNTRDNDASAWERTNELIRQIDEAVPLKERDRCPEMNDPQYLEYCRRVQAKRSELIIRAGRELIRRARVLEAARDEKEFRALGGFDDFPL